MLHLKNRFVLLLLVACGTFAQAQTKQKTTPRGEMPTKAATSKPSEVRVENNSIGKSKYTKPAESKPQTQANNMSQNPAPQQGGNYKYETAPNDPLGVKIYTLANGLKVYMSVNKNEPRIQTFVATRAGSKNDPTDATGLAHYLEHMLFKGTSKIGTLDWEKERVLLKKISDLYEKRRSVKDEAERTALYAQIDATSQEASKLVVANEYDKLMSSLGAKGTNAFTSLERTCYVNDIPSNQLDKWCRIEAERLNELVLRLFHTELEAVYEEFNIGQDNDSRKMYKAMMENLFPAHTYGTQTTIGTGEHLKNPSMEKIHQFFSTYYVPNNMAIMLSGDFNPDEAVATIEKHFGRWQRKPVAEWKNTPQPAISAPIVKEITGTEKASMQIGYRFGGVATADPLMLDLVSALLNNGQAGIIDLNLLQQQKVLKANAYNWTLHDYSAFMMMGTPREGQSLEEVRDLLLQQIEKLKKGEFDEWLIAAAIKNMKLERIKAAEQNRNRTSEMLEAFILEQDWKTYCEHLDKMSKLTKAEVVAFANKNFANNYVVIFKRMGEDKTVTKVEKPKITPVPLNRKDESVFQQDFKKIPDTQLAPKFLDFKNDIKNQKLSNGVAFDYIKNTENPTFQLYYTFEMGKNHDKMLPVAIKLLPYLGTDKYTPEQLQQEFFKLGLSFDVFTSDDRSYITLQGLEESYEEGVKLFEHILANIKPDAKAMEGAIADILKSRADVLNDKRTILRSGMVNYAKYGKKSPFTDILSEEELKALKVDDVITKLKGLTGTQHTVFYYGTRAQDEAANIITKHHKVPAKLAAVPEETKYPEIPTAQNKVYFVNFPMVQAEVMMLSKGDTYNVNQRIMSEWYNDYFGMGLSSIMFQEIREAKALAYSTYAAFGSPLQADRSHYVQAYVGTQADKLKEAVTSVKAIVEDMPVAPAQIENARQSIMKKIESERITKDNIYWTYLSAKKLNLDHDVRKDVYETIKVATQEDLVKFQKTYVKGRNYAVLVMGDKTKLDMEYLKTLGTVEELSLKDVFGYEKVHP
jgi:zinc protease